jgi:hypothetical protein
LEHKWNHIKATIAAIGLVLLIFNSSLVIESARSGIDLCLKTVIPSLFPFFVLSMFLVNTWKSSDSYLLRFITQTLAIPIEAGSALIPSVLGGYPVGAKSVGDLFLSKQIDKIQGEWLLSFCNNAGPSFIFGMVSGFFTDRKMIWILWFIQIFSAAITALVIPSRPKYLKQRSELEVKKEGCSILVSASKAMCQVCCWVILFRVLISFMNVSILRFLPSWLRVMITGMFELTNGCYELLSIRDERLRFILCACMLSFGGFCVLLQTVSVTKGLSIRFYLKGKIIQTLLCFVLSCGIVCGQGCLIAMFILMFVIVLRKIQNRCRNPEVLPV